MAIGIIYQQWYENLIRNMGWVFQIVFVNMGGSEIAAEITEKKYD